MKIRLSKIFGLISLAAYQKAYAGCVFDPEYGEEYYMPTIEVSLTFILLAVLFSYPWKDWAEEHPWFAVLLILVAPVLVGVISLRGGVQC